MATTSRLNIEVKARDEASPKIDKASKSMDGMKTAASALSAVLSGALTNAIKNMGKEMVELAHVQERAEASLTHTTGAMADEWKQFASEIQATSIFGDEEVIQKALVPLNIMFKDTPGMVKTLTQTAVDFASVMGKDVGQSAQMLGRYINEGSKGMSMLKRQGIFFTEEVQKQVVALEEQGKHQEAQLVMAEAVRKQFEGQAEAIANTNFGRWENFRNLLGDVKEEFGFIIDDYIAPLLEKAKEMLKWIQSWDETTKAWVVKGGGLALALGALATIYTSLQTIRNLMATMSAINILSGSTTGAVAATASITGLISKLGRVVPAIMAVIEGWRIGKEVATAENEGGSWWKGLIKGVIDIGQAGNIWVAKQFDKIFGTNIGGTAQRGRDVVTAWAQGKTYQDWYNEQINKALEEHQERLWGDTPGTSPIVGLDTDIKSAGILPTGKTPGDMWETAELVTEPRVASPTRTTPRQPTIRQATRAAAQQGYYLINNQMMTLIGLAEQRNMLLSAIAGNGGNTANVGYDLFQQTGAPELR